MATPPIADDQHVQTSLRLPLELHQALLARSRQEDRSINATVREAVRRYLAEPARS